MYSAQQQYGSNKVISEGLSVMTFGIFKGCFFFCLLFFVCFVLLCLFFYTMEGLPVTHDFSEQFPFGNIMLLIMGKGIMVSIKAVNI